jgi:hypothetical protein
MFSKTYPLIVLLIAIVLPGGTTAGSCPTSCGPNEVLKDCKCDCPWPRFRWVTRNYPWDPWICERRPICCRRLQDTTKSILDEAGLRTLVEQCGSVMYQLSVFVVNRHVALVAAPHEDSTENSVSSHEVDCSLSLFIHHDSYSKSRKEIGLFDRQDQKLDPSGLFEVGAVLLSDLEKAYNAVELRDITNDAGYGKSVVRHNCADFITDMAAALNIQVTRDVTSFVARRLWDNAGTDLASEIRQNFDLLKDLAAIKMGMELEETATDQELVEHLVETRTSQLY